MLHRVHAEKEQTAIEVGDKLLYSDSRPWGVGQPEMSLSRYFCTRGLRAVPVCMSA